MNYKSIKILFFVFSILPILLWIYSFEKFQTLLIRFFQTFFTSNFKEVNLKEFDQFTGMFSLILFLVISFLYIFFYLGLIRIKFLDKLIKKICFTSKEFISGFLIIYLFIVISLSAPLISPVNPNYYKDVSITKLLPPFSKMNFIELKKDKRIDFTPTKLLENLSEDSRIYFTNLEIRDTLIIIYKKRTKEIFSIKEVVTVNERPIIKSQTFLLGTDEFGRDLLSRIIYSIRLSIVIALFSVLISFLLGSTIGYIAGVFGGLIDNILMRIVDFFLSFPILFFVIFLIAFVGNSIILLIIVFGFSGWMYVARLARNETIACMKKEFIQTLILVGQSKFKIIIKHILPNTFSPILITLIFLMSNVIIAESALSFLGLGIQPPTPTLGGIIKSGYDYLSINWWISLFGSLSLVIIIISFNLFSEGLKKIIHK